MLIHVEKCIQLRQPRTLFGKLRFLGEWLSKLALCCFLLAVQAFQLLLGLFQSRRNSGKGIVETLDITLGTGANGNPVGHLTL